MKLESVIQVVIGAGIGGGLRYALGGWIAERWGTSFPWHTMVINVSGAFLLGLLMALSVERGLVPSSMRLLLGVGLLGGFTTFSTLSYESMALVEQGLIAQGAANMFGSAVLGLVAAIIGLFVGRAI
jgi:CrcB protein